MNTAHKAEQTRINYYGTPHKILFLNVTKMWSTNFTNKTVTINMYSIINYQNLM